MSEDDEEKTGFHMKERVYYFTHMPNGLKNSRATLQRTMETVLAEQREKNVEVQLEEAVIKSKLEQDLIEDVEETLYKLQRVNMKLNSSGCVFRIEEGKFLCYVETTKGIKANPEKTTATRTRNLLHSDRESSADTDSHNKIPKKNLQAYK
ncbi:hypothetical protein Tco_1127308, partial [Tanacetum coccineum]